ESTWPAVSPSTTPCPNLVREDCETTNAGQFFLAYDPTSPADPHARLQGRASPGVRHGHPPSHGTRRDFQNLCHFLDGMTFPNSSHGQTPTTLQLCRAAWGSHPAADSKTQPFCGHYFSDAL